MPGETRGGCDPRSRLAREKYFCLRPRPLERWLWSKRIPASAERVFWLHWQEGMQRGDWCSEIPLSRVARECDLDVSTVTRAYQVLTRLDCLRRTDQGRDPANPFQQATALTEVRIPRELLLELNRHPDRRASASAMSRNSNPAHRPEGGEGQAELSSRQEEGEGHGASSQPGATGNATRDTPVSTIPLTNVELGADSGSNHPDISGGRRATEECAASKPDSFGEVPAARSEDPSYTTPSEVSAERAKPADQESLADPFPGLTGRERVRAISELVESLSASERCAYQEALRLHQPSMVFDADSKVPPSGQITLQRVLAAMCPSHSKIDDCDRSRVRPVAAANGLRPRKLSAFELGRLSHQLQSTASVAGAPELMRQIVWSIEVGALKRFDLRHAVHIALKKIREGTWTRPHRMPPNWVRALSNAPVPETCGYA